MRALQAQAQFKVRALTRDPAKRRGLADEVVEADFNRPETLHAAFNDKSINSSFTCVMMSGKARFRMVLTVDR